MTAGGRTSAPPSVLELDAPDPGLDVAAAAQAGVRTIRFRHPIRLDADEPLATLAMLRVIREAEAEGLGVSWHAELTDRINPELLVHLPAPRGAGERLAEWRRRYRPGLCYYRIGPDFVFIKDVRQPDASSRFRLDGVVTAFRSLEAVVAVADLDSASAKLLDDLRDENLALQFGPHATLLPNRMRRWPVPALDV